MWYPAGYLEESILFLEEWTIWALALGVINVGLAIAVTVHAVLWKRDSRAVVAWVGLAWLTPLLGAVAYWVLGINRVHRKAIELNLAEDDGLFQPPAPEPDDQIQVETFIKSDPNLLGLAKAGRRLSGVRLVSGNRIQPLIDGDEAYPSMIEAIDDAQHSVALLSYIFDSDRAGDEFLQSLVKARDRGVQVGVLIDDVGSKYSRPNMVNRLKEAGIQSASFLPTRLPRLPTYANMRNHRKILVTDGKVAFTGGTNIREGHCLKLDPDYPVQCLHFRIKGPVVAQLQRVFAIDWASATGEILGGELWFPELETAGMVWARGIEHGPDEHFEKLTDLMAAALASANRRVTIITPYFLPNASLIRALNVASMRGVDVRIYLPGENNIALVQWATTAQMWEILEKGCRVFYTDPPFDHTKLMLVDNAWSLIGSTNWDPRSLRLNFEFNVECYGPEFTGELNRIVARKVCSAREVTLEDVNQRSIPVRLRDGLAQLLSPYL
jgi:cardiolipin synthase